MLNVALFDVVNCSSVGGFVVLVNGLGVRDGVEPNGFVSKEKKKNNRQSEVDCLVLLLFGSGTSLSRLTRVLNLSPRKLSGVLREADNDDDDIGLELVGFAFVPLVIVGYSKFPPLLLVAKFVFEGDIELVIFQGFDDACCCCCGG